MAENFQNLEKKIRSRKLKGFQISGIQRNSHQGTLYSNCQMSKTENFESSKKKVSCHVQGNPIRLLVAFSAETFQPRREWNDIFNILEKNKLPTKNTMPYKTVLQK